jgi:hypothetical protein
LKEPVASTFRVEEEGHAGKCENRYRGKETELRGRMEDGAS